MGARVAFLTAPSSPSAAGSTAASTQTLVPAEAVDANGDMGTVWVIDGTTVEKRAVRLGPKTSAGQTITSGLSSGTRVAVGDLSRLTDNARVSIQE
jgi:hypothetical protein